ncbi:phosphoribosyltransferase family protein [[Roseibacterium] beibuensis]|uniref:phosphoribosyltransferase family protein n=1 Tax=[Roseibacterium] beibuensis TaxID=1193142 RepID=UPI0038676ADE
MCCAKKLGHIPCISLWANRHSRKENLLFSGPASRVNRYEFDEIFREGGVDRVLLVDDVVHSGHTLKEAVEFITANSKLLQSNEVELRTAALFFLTSATFKPDFIALSHSRVARKINVSK